MLTCKQVSKALAESDYIDLPKHKQIMLRLHISMCFVCHGFNRNIMRFQDMVRAFKKKEDQLDVGPVLSDEVRQQMRDQIAKQRQHP
jgi:hypothetical protein